MKKLIIAGALSAAFASPAVFAQATGFTGIYGQAGLGVSSAGSESSINSPSMYEGDSGFSLSNDFGQANISGSVALGYNHGFRNGFNIGANIFYSIRNDDAGSVSVGDTTDNFEINNKLKNIWGISVEPGYAFTDNSLGFVKLGWAQADSSLDISDSLDGSSSLDFGKTNGFLYGIGYKHAVSKNVYLGVEVYQIAFNSKTETLDGGGTTIESRPNYTYGGLILGAKF